MPMANLDFKSSKIVALVGSSLKKKNTLKDLKK